MLECKLEPLKHILGIYIGIFKNSHLEIRLLLGSFTKIGGFGYFFEHPKLDSFPASSYILLYRVGLPNIGLVARGLR